MYRVLGIIAEYNPFHNGHLYHLQQSKKEANCDYTICVISGNFVQRGESSLVNKWVKAQMALESGADLVLELPTIYSISSAENFAEGGIKLLDSLGIVNVLSFGSETSDMAVLNEFANVLYSQPKEYLSLLNHELGTGISYPKARENAILMYLNDIRRYANVLSAPNNILGIEYLKALKKQRSNIQPLNIVRKDVGYHEDSIHNHMASASFIRKMVRNNKIAQLSEIMPSSSFSLLEEEVKKGNIVSDLSRYEKIIIYNLRKMTTKEISQIPDVTEGLENAIKQAACSCNSISEFMNIVKCKRYTETRIKRILLYALLNITKKEMELSKRVIPYIRVLGFNQNGKQLLSGIATTNPKLPIITSVKKFFDHNTNKQVENLLKIDIFSTDIYTLGYEYDSWAGLDFTKKIVEI